MLYSNRPTAQQLSELTTDPEIAAILKRFSEEVTFVSNVREGEPFRKTVWHDGHMSLTVFNNDTVAYAHIDNDTTGKSIWSVVINTVTGGVIYE